jgi:hypothetical protein
MRMICAARVSEPHQTEVFIDTPNVA